VAAKDPRDQEENAECVRERENIVKESMGEIVNEPRGGTMNETKK
jgi:hypothetical protein